MLHLIKSISKGFPFRPRRRRIFFRRESPALKQHWAFLAPGHPALFPDDNAAWLRRHPKSEKGEPEIPFFTLS